MIDINCMTESLNNKHIKNDNLYSLFAYSALLFNINIYITHLHTLVNQLIMMYQYSIKTPVVDETCYNYTYTLISMQLQL